MRTARKNPYQKHRITPVRAQEMVSELLHAISEARKTIADVQAMCSHTDSLRCIGIVDTAACRWQCSSCKKMWPHHPGANPE